MRSKGGRTIKLNPVDDDHQVTDHPARANLEAIMDQKLFAQRIKSERSAAYWFAASLWGVTGLAIGAFLGVFITLTVLDQSEGRIRDNIVSGFAIDAARDTVDSRDPVLRDPQQQP
jgi:hypothetical protein